jgi:hypothetical protein
MGSAAKPPRTLVLFLATGRSRVVFDRRLDFALFDAGFFMDASPLGS